MIEEIDVEVELNGNENVGIDEEIDTLKGPPGPVNTLEIGMVTKGEEAHAEIVGESPNQKLNLVLPQGEKGNTGDKGEKGNTGEKGEKGDTGDKGEKGDTGLQGPQGPQGDIGPQGPIGPKGDTGEGFSIYRVYKSEEEMEADKENVSEGKFVLIANDVETEENARLYVKDKENFKFLVDMSGAKGIQGPQGPQGEQGPQGKQGIQGPERTTRRKRRFSYS